MTSPADQSVASRPSRSPLLWMIPPAVGAATGFVFRLIFTGDPERAYNAMDSAFILLVPVAVGAVTVYVAERLRRHSWGYYFGAAALANVLLVAATFLVYIEGLICAIVVLPLFAVLGGIAGIFMGAVCQWTGHPRSTLLSVLALPLVLGSLEHHVPLPNTVDTVTAVRLIDAPPDRVWQAILYADDIQPEEMGSAWMYRIGVPLPRSAVTVESNGERVRHIEMGKGIRFDQVVVEWEPERRVRYIYRFTPDSFPPHALDDHVRIGGDFFDLHDTEYLLEGRPDGTRLTVRMSYRVSTHFNWYARLVGRLLVGNFEKTALDFYARRAEGMAEPSDQ